MCITAVKIITKPLTEILIIIKNKSLFFMLSRTVQPDGHCL